MIGNGIGTVASADAETTMTDLLDAKETGTCSIVVDPDGTEEIVETVETASASANVTVTVTTSVSAEIGEIGGEGPRLLRPGRGRLHLT